MRCIILDGTASSSSFHFFNKNEEKKICIKNEIDSLELKVSILFLFFLLAQLTEITSDCINLWLFLIIIKCLVNFFFVDNFFVVTGVIYDCDIGATHFGLYFLPFPVMFVILLVEFNYFIVVCWNMRNDGGQRCSNRSFTEIRSTIWMSRKRGCL